MLATLALVLGAACPRTWSRSVADGLGHRRARHRHRLRDASQRALVWSEPLFCAILVWLLTLAIGRGQGLDVRVSPRLVGVLPSPGRCFSLATRACSCCRRSSSPRRSARRPRPVAAPESEPSPFAGGRPTLRPCEGPQRLHRRRPVRDARTRASPCSRSSISPPRMTSLTLPNAFPNRAPLRDRRSTHRCGRARVALAETPRLRVSGARS